MIIVKNNATMQNERKTRNEGGCLLNLAACADFFSSVYWSFIFFLIVEMHQTFKFTCMGCAMVSGTVVVDYVDVNPGDG